MMIKKRRAQKEQEEQPMLYWLVEITLTSGEGLQFYVSAINHYEANLKAHGYADLAESSESLRECYKNKGFTLLP